MALLKKRTEYKKGYTLIELIVAVALLSLFFSIALPNSSLIKTLNQNTELRIIQKDLKQARNKAVLENRTVMASFNGDKNLYIIKYSENAIIKKHKLESGLKIVSPISKDIYFNGTGRVGNSDSIIIKKSNGEMYKISIQVNTATISLQEIN